VRTNTFIAANERTFLGYLRTGQAFAVLGVIISQLMELNHTQQPSPTIGYFIVSRPLSLACHGSAAVITTLGAVRFFRLQKSMALGQALSGGWEVSSTALIAVSVSTEFEA
jgi:uncharacterized membrane protein YidH (DUF202 family)